MGASVADVLLAIRVDEKGAVKSVENVAGAMDKLADKGKKAEDSTKKFGATMGGELSSVAQQYAGRLGSVGEAMATLGPHGLAAAAGVGAIGTAAAAAVAHVIALADKIDNLGARTGFGAQSLQQLDYAARLTNTSLDMVAQSAIRMQAELDRSPAKFAEIGLSVERLRSMAPEKQFYAVGRAIADISDQSAKMAAVRDIFGRSGDAILPLLSRLDELRAAADEAGYALGDSMLAQAGAADDALDKLSANFDALKGNVGGLVLELVPISDGLDLVASAVAKITRELRELNDAPTGKLEMMLAFLTFGGSLAVGKAVRTFEQMREPVDKAPTPIDFRPEFGGIEDPTWDAMMRNVADMDAALRKRATSERAADEAARQLAAAERAAAARLARLFPQDVLAASLSLLGPTRSMAAALAQAAHQGTIGYLPMGAGLPQNLGPAGRGPAQSPTFSGSFDLTAGAGAAFATSIKDSLKGIVGQLPQVILGAIQGGGSVMGAIGGAIGGGLLGSGTKLGDTITKGLSGALGKTLGGALGAAMPVVGSLLGAGLGKLFGGLFGGGPSKAEKEAQKQQALEKALPQLDSIMNKIDELLERTLKAGASGLADVFTWMGGQAEMTTDRLNRMGTVGMAMFQAMRAQGMSTLEALRLMGPAIQAALKAAEESGTALTGPFAALADFYRKVEDNKGLVSAIDGLAAAMEALALTGQLNADTFAAMQAEAQSMFDQLIAQGFTAEQALAVMAPLLFAISEAAERYGFALDEATRAQIDQAKSMGLFENMKSPMETLVELQGEMLKVVAALAQYFGAVLPDSVQKYIDKLNKVPQPPGPPGQNGGEAPPEPMETPGSVPGYASGGYIPATPGGRVVRVSEGGEGEYIVPESKMGRGGVTVHYSPVVNMSGVRVEDEDKVAEKVGVVLEQERTRLPGLLREVMRDEMRAQGVL